MKWLWNIKVWNYANWMPFFRPIKLQGKWQMTVIALWKQAEIIPSSLSIKENVEKGWYSWPTCNVCARVCVMDEIVCRWIILSVVYGWSWSVGAEHADSWLIWICCSNILAAGKKESSCWLQRRRSLSEEGPLSPRWMFSAPDRINDIGFLDIMVNRAVVLSPSPYFAVWMVVVRIVPILLLPPNMVSKVWFAPLMPLLEFPHGHWQTVIEAPSKSLTWYSRIDQGWSSHLFPFSWSPILHEAGAPVQVPNTYLPHCTTRCWCFQLPVDGGDFCVSVWIVMLAKVKSKDLGATSVLSGVGRFYSYLSLFSHQRNNITSTEEIVKAVKLSHQSSRMWDGGTERCWTPHVNRRGLIDGLWLLASDTSVALSPTG